MSTQNNPQDASTSGKPQLSVEIITVFTIPGKDGQKQMSAPIPAFVGDRDDVLESLSKMPPDIEVAWGPIAQEEFKKIADAKKANQDKSSSSAESAPESAEDSKQ